MFKIARLSDVDPDFNAARAAAAGANAALTYLVIMYADMALTGSRSDDLLMLGRPLTKDPWRARLLGLVAHTSFGAFMGLLYGGVTRRRLPGPGWARGVMMMMAENAILWPLTFIVDRYHPSMRSGELPRLNTPVPALQQIVRHVGFGAVMGLNYAPPSKGAASSED